MDQTNRLFERTILEDPTILENWRKLHQNLSVNEDDRTESVAQIISSISRNILVTNMEPIKNFAAKQLVAPAPKLSNDSEDEKEIVLAASLELAHKLIDAGDIKNAKAGLIKLCQTQYAHINAWANYFLVKCLFDQYQLVTALWLIKRLSTQSELPDTIEPLVDALGSAINDGISYQSDICSHYIKPSFYLKQIKKVRLHSELNLATSHDCYKHYQAIGSRLGINPTPWFETKRYLGENIDIAKSGCCPFFHYLVAGKKEGRIASGYSSRFASEVENQKSLPTDIYEESRNWIQALPKVDQLNNQELSTVLSNPYVLSISHDCYYKIPGGIQLCIQREQRCFQELKLDYIHIYARQPWPIPLHSKSPYLELIISRNGEQLGVVNLNDLGKAIELATPSVLLIHSLLGISPEDIQVLIIKANIPRVIYWMHDYSALCSSYQLLRNKVFYCGAPALGSRQCDYCFYGNSRIGNIDSLSKVLELPQTELVFPSQAALEVWRGGSLSLGLKHRQEITILNHMLLIESASVHRDYSSRKPSIAFLGHPAFAKGWDKFAELVRDPDLFTIFDWYHLGATKDSLSDDIEFIHVSIADSPTAMIDAVKEAQIDFALVWPEWPETFCLTAYEAVIGGANIITNTTSGNVARFAESHPYGHVIDGGIKELKEFLLNLQPLQIQAFSFPDNVRYEYSRMSAELVA